MRVGRRLEAAWLNARCPRFTGPLSFRPMLAELLALLFSPLSALIRHWLPRRRVTPDEIRRFYRSGRVEERQRRAPEPVAFLPCLRPVSEGRRENECRAHQAPASPLAPPASAGKFVNAVRCLRPRQGWVRDALVSLRKHFQELKMKMFLATQEPHDHHCVPQFFLRNFASDPAKTRITTVGKHGVMAIWAERAIKSVGYERDFYVHMERGIPVSVETGINRRIETPISQSDTWAKIASARTDALDKSDRPILYALIRHLEARTPHYETTMQELAQMAADPASDIPFTDEERAHFAFLRMDTNSAKAMLNYLATTMEWTGNNFKGSGIAILRSPVPLRSSTTPVLVVPAPAHPAIKLPLPGMTPYTLVLTLNPNTVAPLNLGDFDGEFVNTEMDWQTALGFNRHFVGQFGKFAQVRHLITKRVDLTEDMTWAPYDLVKEDGRTITFRRRSA